MGYLFHDNSLKNIIVMRHITFQIMILDSQVTETKFSFSGCKIFVKM